MVNWEFYREELSDELSNVLRRHGITHSPYDLISEWEGLVELCEQGYDMCDSEYFNDITVREWLQYIVDAKDVQELRVYREFVDRLDRIDQRFKAILVPGEPIARWGRYWWLRSVPDRGSAEFAEAMRSYGIVFRVVGEEE